jgi:SPP1 gp7 family putative phage head morphogenesis protein
MPIKPQEPAGIERRYQKALKQYARRLGKACNLILIPEVPRLVEKAKRYRPDDAASAVSESSWVDQLADLLEGTLGVVTGVQEAGLASVTGQHRATLDDMPGPSTIDEIGVIAFAEEISNHGRRQIVRMTKAQYGEQYARAEPWLDDMLRTWESENLRLIRSIPERYVDDLRGTITRAINQGQSATDLTATIKSTYDQPVKRAQLIANDQVGKLHSQLAQARQQAIGVKEYVWRGILDSRERPEHRRREGNTYKWSNPPSDGHPGSAIRCRCYGQPVFPPRDEVQLQ